MQRQRQRETRPAGWNDLRKITPQKFIIDATTGGIFFFESLNRNTGFTGLGSFIPNWSKRNREREIKSWRTFFRMKPAA